MESLAVLSRSPEETWALGEKLGVLLENGDFLGLSGELGAGKTQLVRGIAAGAGVDPALVCSPTFAIVQSYPGKTVAIHHADFYRLRDSDELFATGFFDLEGAFLVEWIDQLPTEHPSDWLHLQLSATDTYSRTIEARAHGVRAQALVTAWLSSR